MSTSSPVPGGLGALGDHPVARIGFGVMQLAEGAGAPDRDDAIAVLRRAVELGVNHLDTAGFYGPQHANDLIAAALRPYPDDLALVSKVGATHRGGRLVPAQRPAELRAGVEADLQHLQVDRLAVVNLRRMDAAPGIVATGDQLVDLDAQLAELVALRDEGKIDAFGLSNVTADQLERALPAGPVCVQNAYSLVNRVDEPVLEACRRHGVAWVPYFPLGSAFPNYPKVTEQPAVRAAAERLGVRPAQIGLAWLLGHDPGILLIPGTSSMQHLAANVAAGDVELDAATTADLDRIAG